MNQSRQFLINASAHDIPLLDGMIHTVVTSPPYFSLRRYQGEQEVDWPTVSYSPMPGLEPLTISPMQCALGLEPTPEAYIGHLVLCFREVRRVLREDGSCWIIIGDSFCANTRGSMGDKVGLQGGWTTQQQTGEDRPDKHAAGLHQGDLMGIPHRLMFALQGDGWLCRNDVCWSKKSPMPESVSGWRWERCRVKVKAQPHREHPLLGEGYTADVENRERAQYTPCPGCSKCEATGGYVLRRGSWRHTRAHETVLMCAKSMGYFADQERVREAHQPDSIKRYEYGLHAAYGDKQTYGGNQSHAVCNTERMGDFINYSGRNPRSVMTPRPSSYSGSHYAVFPPDLIAPLLRATAPTRVCPVCGAPWCPVVEREGTWEMRKAAGADSGSMLIGHNAEHGRGMSHDLDAKVSLLGHRPTCDHDADPIPGWALDPFAGTFTTGAVCAELGVNCIGLDISLDYLDEHAKPRIKLTPSGALETLPLFAELEA